MIQFYSKSLLVRFSGTLALCLLTIGLTAQVFTGDITFATQTDLDNFTQSGAPGGDKFTSVVGDVTLSPTATISSLANLSDLTSISAELTIQNYRTAQTSAFPDPLSNFSSLVNVGGLSVLGNNNSSPTNGIRSVSNATLQTVGNDLVISGINTAGTNLPFTLDALTSIGDDFRILNNFRLANFSAISLTDVGGLLTIDGNGRLITLDRGVNNITSIGGGVQITNNQRLSDVSDLGATDPNYLGLELLEIRNNTALVNFGTGTNDFRVRVLDRLIITNNIMLQTTSTNLEVGNGGGDRTLQIINFSNNIALTTIANIFDKGHQIIVSDYQLTGNTALTALGGEAIVATNSIIIQNNSALNDLPSFDGVTTALTDGLTISGNPVLQRISELGDIVSVDGDIVINNNASLLSLDVFNSLTSVIGAVSITNNASISSLDDFTGTTLDIGDSFTITGNGNLSDCCKPFCTTTVNGAPMDGTNPDVNISGNTGECTDKQTAVSNCAAEGNSACLTAAPVEFIAFTGSFTGSAIVLDWATATETENDYFQVERSNDGATFTAIGQVTGSGDSQQELNYTFSDLEYQSGINYYRLRQVDYDGTEDFSKVIAVDAGAGNLALGMFPNPTTGSDIRVRLSSDWDADNVTLDIYSAGGQLMISTTNTRNAIPVNRLAPGMYAVRVSDGTRTATERLVVR